MVYDDSSSDEGQKSYGWNKKKTMDKERVENYSYFIISNYQVFRKENGKNVV